MGQNQNKQHLKICSNTLKQEIIRNDHFIQSIATFHSNLDKWKLNDEGNAHFYNKHYPEIIIGRNNLSMLEEKVPYEIMLYILQHLLPEDLITLSMVSRNFRTVWTEHPFLWYSVSDSMESFIRKRNVENLLNDTSSSLINWKQMYCQSICFMKYPEEFSNFVDRCVFWNRIYGEWNKVRKIGFLGPVGCGKSTYCKLFSTQILDESMKPTIGCEFYTQFLNVKFEEKGKTQIGCIKLEIWDISMLFATIYRGLSTVYFCFDLSSEESLHQLLEQFKHFCVVDLNIEDFDTHDPDSFFEKLYERRKDIVFLGMKKEYKNIPNSVISRYLSRFIDSHIDFKERFVAYYEVSSKQHDKTTFYPISHIVRRSSVLESFSQSRLTLITKENEEQFRTFGDLD